MGKGTKKWLQYKIDLRRQYPYVIASLRFVPLISSYKVEQFLVRNMYLIFCSSAPPFPHLYLYSIPRETESLENTLSLKPLLKLIDFIKFPDYTCTSMP